MHPNHPKTSEVSFVTKKQFKEKFFKFHVRYAIQSIIRCCHRSNPIHFRKIALSHVTSSHICWHSIISFSCSILLWCPWNCKLPLYHVLVFLLTKITQNFSQVWIFHLLRYHSTVFRVYLFQLHTVSAFQMPQASVSWNSQLRFCILIKQSDWLPVTLIGPFMSLFSSRRFMKWNATIIVTLFFSIHTNWPK